MKKVRLNTIIGIVLCFLCVACGKKDNQSVVESSQQKVSESVEDTISQTSSEYISEQIIGTWYWRSCCRSRVVTFYSDGTLILQRYNDTGFQYESEEYKWIVNNHKVTYMKSDEVIEVEVINSGENLVLTDNDDVYIYWKSAALAEENDDTEYGIIYCEGFMNGYAKIVYREDNLGEYHTGFMDTLGNIVLQLDGISTEMTVMPSGHVFYKENNYTDGKATLRVIKVASGEVLSSYAEDENNKIMAYGDDYVIMEQYTGGFDENYYCYMLYNYDGEPIREILMEEPGEQVKEIDYLGNEIFYVKGQGYYFAETGVFGNAGSFGFIDVDSALLMEYIRPHMTSDGKVHLVIQNKSGERQEISTPYDFEIDYLNGMNDGICVFLANDTLYLYDIEDNEFRELNVYVDKLNWDSIEYRSETHSFVFKDGIIAVPLRGSDGESYWALCDKEWNVLIEPTTGYMYNGGDRIVQNGKVYDTAGKFIFEIGGMEYAYSDDIFFTYTGDYETFCYMDKDGNVLFEKINFDDAKIIH